MDKGMDHRRKLAALCAVASPAHVVQHLLLNIRQDVIDPTTRLVLAGPQVGVAGPIGSPTVGRQPLRQAFVVETAQGELLDVVPALRHPGRLAGRLDRRQQEGNQDADDRNDHQ